VKLTIHYDSSWRNSFLDGSNNEPLSSKKGRKFIGSMTELKKQGNYIDRELSSDTVMGVLNRLVGDQRKLYQSRQAKDYYFKDIEEKVSFLDKPESNTAEVVFIRNITGSEDQNSFTGAIKTNDPIFSSDYSPELWGVLSLNFSQVLTFINDQNSAVNSLDIALDPISIIERLELLNKLKAVPVEAEVEQVLSKLKAIFPDVDYKLTTKGDIAPISFYTSALYIQLTRLQSQYDLSTALTKAGGLSGISKRGFTKKDFMVKYTTGAKKLVFGNPYQLKERIKGQGEVTSLLTKSVGQLEILIDVPYETAQKIRQDIYNAGVSSFYLGKKGLAWLDDKISLEELH
jgi:hypothetical protein